MHSPAGKTHVELQSPHNSKMQQRKVFVSYTINVVSEINALTSTFKVDLKLFYEWKEPLVGDRPKGSIVDISKEKLWNPEIIIVNSHSLVEESCKIVVSKPGEIKMTSHLRGECFLTSMSLRMFPFDCQNLQISLRPYKMPVDECLLVASPSSASAMDKHVTHEWETLGHCLKSHVTDPAKSSTNKEYSAIDVVILTQRKSGWFVANIFIPTGVFLVISWLTFGFEVHSRSDRNELSLSTLLASLANKYVVSDQLPKVPYRTMVDIYVDGCFYLQVLTLVSNWLVYKYDSSALMATGMRAYFPTLNSIFFILQCFGAYLLHDWIFTRIKNHNVDVSSWVLDAEKRDEVNEVITFATEEHIKKQRHNPDPASVDKSCVKSPLSKGDIMSPSITQDSDGGHDVSKPSLLEFYRSPYRLFEKLELDDKVEKRRVSAVSKKLSIVGALSIFLNRAITRMAGSQLGFNSLASVDDDFIDMKSMAGAEMNDENRSRGLNELNQDLDIGPMSDIEAKLVRMKQSVQEKRREMALNSVKEEIEHQFVSSIANSMAQNQARSHFNHLVSSNDENDVKVTSEDLKRSAAVLLQRHWRKKQSRRKEWVLAQTMRHLLLDACARKIQNLFIMYKSMQKEKERLISSVTHKDDWKSKHTITFHDAMDTAIPASSPSTASICGIFPPVSEPSSHNDNVATPPNPVAPPSSAPQQPTRNPSFSKRSGRASGSGEGMAAIATRAVKIAIDADSNSHSEKEESRIETASKVVKFATAVTMVAVPNPLPSSSPEISTPSKEVQHGHGRDKGSGNSDLKFGAAEESNGKEGNGRQENILSEDKIRFNAPTIPCETPERNGPRRTNDVICLASMMEDSLTHENNALKCSGGTPALLKGRELRWNASKTLQGLLDD